jgi:hypothetical protein
MARLRIPSEANTAAGWKAGPKDGRRELAGLTAPLDGRWVAAGQEPGLRSGEHLCQQLDGAHVCSAEEIFTAEKQGDFAGAPDGTVWLPRMAAFDLDGTRFEGDPSAACNLYTYPTGDRAWNGFIRLATDRSTGEALTKVAYDPGPAEVTYDPNRRIRIAKDIGDCLDLSYDGRGRDMPTLPAISIREVDALAGMHTNEGQRGFADRFRVEQPTVGEKMDACKQVMDHLYRLGAVNIG